MKNRFFDSAKRKASTFENQKERIGQLLKRLSDKLRSVNWGTARLQKAKEALLTLSNLTKAYAQGRYREISWKAIVSILAAIIYFINPFDLIPDMIPLLGLTDDASILFWVYNTVKDEVDKFLEWEKAQATLI
jgi:uncharacterized membrane protein YkvA (DUF1232 family)